MVDSKHFSTSTVTREIRQRKVVAKAKGVPKVLLVQRQTVFFDWNSVQPRAIVAPLSLVCCSAWSRSGDNDSPLIKRESGWFSGHKPCLPPPPPGFNYGSDRMWAEFQSILLICNIQSSFSRSQSDSEGCEKT